MTRIPDSPPRILPVPAHAHRPLWSVMIPVYNCIQFLEETLRSVLAQAPSAYEMQIEVVDDCSTDGDVEQLVKRVGQGRIKYFRQPRNLGSVRNFETCLNRATGQLIHLLHGDDKVLPGFYDKVEQLFEKFPSAAAAFTNYNFVNDSNELLFPNSAEHSEDQLFHNYVKTIAERCPIQYVCMVVKRETYEKLGGFYGRIYGEDWEMWARIARDHAIAYTPEILADYRVHTSNISFESFRNGSNFRDINQTIETMSTYVDDNEREAVVRRARRHYARYALYNSEYIWKISHDKETVYKQTTGALRMHSNLPMLLRAGKIFAKMWIHPLRQLIRNAAMNW